MRAVKFSRLPVGHWFKESENGAWHLKSSHDHGTYQHWGTRYEPRFQPNESVLIDDADASAIDNAVGALV